MTPIHSTRGSLLRVQAFTLGRWLTRARIWITLSPVIVLLCAWLWYFSGQNTVTGRPGGKFYAGDFAMYMGAARVVLAGGNPYDHAVLYRTESSLLARQGLRLETTPNKVRVGNPPLFFWALQPVSNVPLRPLAVGWLLSLYAFSALGFLALLRYLGWRNWFVPTLLFLMLPQVIRGALYGNVSPLVFAAVCFSLLLLDRWPAAAGALLCLIWLKPQIGLPVLALMVLFHARSRAVVLGSFCAGSALMLALTIFATGPGSLMIWMRAMTGYYRDIATQTWLPSLSNLYDLWTPLATRTLLTALGIAAALVVTALWWWTVRRRTPIPMERNAWLWIVWFVATPYVHLYDETLLAVPVLALLGRDGFRLSHPLSAFGLYLLAYTWLPTAWTPLELGATVPVLWYLARGADSERRNTTVAILALLTFGWLLYSLLPVQAAVQSLKVAAAGVCLLLVVYRRGARSPLSTSERAA
jgi:hypothetical protein